MGLPLAGGSVLQGLILGPVLSNVLMNDLDAGIELILSKFTEYTELEGAVDFMEDQGALQRNVHILENWAITNGIKFNKWKYCLLHQGWSNCRHGYRLGHEWLEGSLGVLVNSKLNMNHMCPLSAKRSKHILGCIKQSITKQSTKVFFPLYLTLLQPDFDYCMHILTPQYKNNIKIFENI